VTDVTNASRTLLFNIVKGEWDAGAAARFRRSREHVAEGGVVERCEWRGDHDSGPGAAEIAGIAGDQQAALLDSCAGRPGEAKNTYGTGCFLLQNIGTGADGNGTGFVRSKPPADYPRWRLALSIAWSMRWKAYLYGGAVVQWPGAQFETDQFVCTS